MNDAEHFCFGALFPEINLVKSFARGKVLHKDVQRGLGPVASKIQGTVVQVNADGDLITDIAEEQLEGVGRTNDTKIIVDDEHETFGLYDANHNQPSMTLIAIVDPMQTLRLHLVSDSAASMLGVRKGANVEVRW